MGTIPRKVLPVAVLALFSLLVILSVQEFKNSKIEHQLAAEYLNRAKAACGHGPGCADVEVAMKQLRAVPGDTPEQAEAENIRRISTISSLWSTRVVAPSLKM